MIRVQLNNLEKICDDYSSVISSKFKKFSDAFITLIDLITLDRPCIVNDLKGKEGHLTLYASLKILYPNIQKINPVTHDGIRDIINDSLQTSLDPSSKQEKDRLLNKLKVSLADLQTYVTDQKLFSSNSSQLKNIDQKLKLKFPTETIDKKILTFLFNYERYRKEIDNYIGKALNIKVCPYCNRNYITYLSKNGVETSTKKDIGATYDHFFKKELYNSLTLSFYNLIPSCYVCNSNLKLNKDFDHLKNINPLIEGFDRDAFFDFDLTLDPLTSKINFTPKLIEKKGIDPQKKIRIFGNGTMDSSGNVRVFKLQEIYKSHNDTVEDIHLNFDKHNRFYVESLIKELDKLDSSEAEFYRYHFKNYFDEIDFNKRPLSKLSKDIYLKMKSMI